jgi:hypothetical protein
MKEDLVVKDERTVAIENISYRWAYMVLSFGLLIDTAYRGFVRNEASWDLLALVILTGLAATVYQGMKKTLTKRWVFWAAGTALLAAVVSIVIVFVR